MLQLLSIGWTPPGIKQISLDLEGIIYLKVKLVSGTNERNENNALEKSGCKGSPDSSGDMSVTMPL